MVSWGLGQIITTGNEFDEAGERTYAMSEPSQEQTDRKHRSEKRLATEGVPVNPHLPAIESEAEAKRRTKDEIAYRALALMTVAMSAAGQNKETTRKVITDFGISDWLTPKEQTFLAAVGSTEQDRLNLAWRVEAAHTLFWALGYVHALGMPTQQCDPHVLMKIMKQHGAAEPFVAAVRLRALSEILDEADLIYRYHGAGVAARINGKAKPKGLSSSVILERHTALNWLVGYCDQDWDDVTTDT